MPLLYCAEALLSRNKIRHSAKQLCISCTDRAVVILELKCPLEGRTNRKAAQDNWRVTSGYVFDLGRVEKIEWVAGADS
jgi:hypothetical protein